MMVEYFIGQVTWSLLVLKMRWTLCLEFYFTIKRYATFKPSIKFVNQHSPHCILLANITFRFLVLQIQLSGLHAAAERCRRRCIFCPRRRRRFQTAYRREMAFHAECTVSCFQQNNFWAKSNIWYFRTQYFLIISTRVADIVYVDIFPLIYSFA